MPCHTVCCADVAAPTAGPSPPCSATFTLAQLLLKAPCCPLALAVRFGHGQSARTLLAAVRASRSSDAQRQLEDALAWWPSGSELQASGVCAVY